MNGLLLVIGVCFTGAAIALFVRASMLVRIRSAERLEELDAYGFPRPSPDSGERGLAATLDRVAERLAGAVSPRLAGIEESELRTMMLSAGIYDMPPRRFLGYRVLGAILVPTAFVWLAEAAGVGGGLVFLGLLLGLAAGWVLPLSILRRRADQRLARIDVELPELIDTLVVTVEGGVGFSGALQLAAREMHGPLGDELQLTLREQTMGLSSGAALNNLANRADTPAVRSFVRSVLQGENLGVSTGEIMRSLAVEMRARRRASAEERAQRAPVKMLFPLVLFMLPAMFIVILYPAFHNISRAFGA